MCIEDLLDLLRGFSAPCQQALELGEEPRQHQFGRSGSRDRRHALFRQRCDDGLDDACSYYDLKRAAGKKHNAAIICLARRRIDILHATLAIAPTTTTAA